MNTEEIRLFVEVARAGSFAAVARGRDLDPSTVSRLVAGLEAALGLRLFQRTTRRLTLTEAGQRYLEAVEGPLDALDQAGASAMAVTGEPVGELRLTASVTFGQTRIMPLLPEFRRRYPGLALDCRFTDSVVDLVAERIDLAIRLGPEVEGDLIAAKLMPTRYRVVASPGWLAAHPIGSPADLAGQRCLLFTLPAYRRRWRFRDRAGEISEVPITGDITLSPAGSLRDAAVAGLGPALLPDWLVMGDLRTGQLVDALPYHDATATSFDTAAWLVYPSRAWLPAKARVMIDYLRGAFARG